MSIAIVTDSTADVPETLAAQLNIHVVPAILMLGEQSFEDGKGFSRQEFYERLPGMNPLPTTGTPAAGTFESLYQELFSKGAKEIISIHLASSLSSIYSTAYAAAQSFGERVHVIDSESLSLGFGWQVIAAAEAAAQTLDAKKIIQKVNRTRQNMRLFAMLDTLEYIHRSGRVGWARARIGSLLRIKPFIEVRDGQVFSLGQTRTRRRGIARLRDLLLEQGQLERLAILHTNAEADAIDFLNNLDFEIPKDPLIVNVTTIIGTHVGPNGLGFSVVLR
jgi:DegV family protein with EDD domain